MQYYPNHAFLLLRYIFFHSFQQHQIVVLSQNCREAAGTCFNDCTIADKITENCSWSKCYRCGSEKHIFDHESVIQGCFRGSIKDFPLSFESELKPFFSFTCLHSVMKYHPLVSAISTHPSPAFLCIFWLAAKVVRPQPLFSSVSYHPERLRPLRPFSGKIATVSGQL